MLLREHSVKQTEDMSPSPDFSIDISQKADIIQTMDIKFIFKALDNDIRLQIMQWLKEPEVYFAERFAHVPESCDFHGGVCVSAICEKANISQSTASSYLDILLRADLVETFRIGKWTLYRRNEETITRFAEYVKTVL